MYYLSEYQTFNNKDELNTAVKSHLARHKFDLTDTEKLTLRTIARYAVKYPGAAHLKAATIADLIGKSEKTARRAINKLVKFGIIRKVETIRKVTGGKGANILQILPPTNDHTDTSNRKESKNSDVATVKASNSANEPSNSIKQNINTIATEETANGALKRSIPAELYNALKPYFNDRDMYKAVGILWRAKASIDRNITFEQHSSVYVDTFKNVIFHYKRGKVRNLFAYLYGAWRQVAIEIKRRLTLAESDLFYNWLDA
ncbi:helix-turn-helix domain-containing protein [Fervidibacillus halotolerans]|uniref:Helix-turn-helix domain-containing protein n=1 Tax=Fervidibacillus halotolerans TaxID=2980027 RepID=A0A9E8M1D3_9BACI|nr:helix-turn-helix domain-containing protein [Fervidibacillus halotolerans]WAA13386.1 helix-turn-helix domain-containing protein [Fervidibacillus halotolerans]